MTAAPVVLLTDFGLQDGYVAAMKGVILARDPTIPLVDLTHEVPPQDIRRAAFLLATTVPHFPAGAVFVAVVDPGVGTDRRALAIEAAEWRLVGPDNGVLAWALRFLTRDGRLALDAMDGQLRIRSGGRAFELTERRFWRPEVSPTFHGRDIFAPVAAELSLGRALPELGRSLPAIVDLPWPEPRREPDGSITAQVVTIDRYGNLITSLRAADLPDRSGPGFEIAGRTMSGLAPHFQQAGRELVALLGSSGFVEVAAPNGSAAAVLGACVGDVVRVLRADGRAMQINSAHAS